VQATSTATEEVIMMMAVNFPRRERLRRGYISAFSSGGSVTHNFCQCQEFRTNLQTGAVSGIWIYEEADAVVLQSKLDGTSGGCEVICFADYKDTLATEFGQDLGQQMTLRGRDEQDLAASDISNALYPTDTCRMLRNYFSSQRVIERASKRVRPENADQERGIWAGKRIRRPIHEFREVEKEGGL
jgi:hypothetical protein